MSDGRGAAGGCGDGSLGLVGGRLKGRLALRLPQAASTSTYHYPSQGLCTRSPPFGPRRFYCPTPSEEITCPAGNYCKAGSLQPQPCPFLTSCPEGSGGLPRLGGLWG